jgi:hypothetical protein
VQHCRAVFGPVLADVGRLQALGQDIVELQGAALPGAADGVLQAKLQLGAIEGAFRQAMRDSARAAGEGARAAAEAARAAEAAEAARERSPEH